MRHPAISGTAGDGKLIQVNFREGQDVKADDVLAQDPRGRAARERRRLLEHQQGLERLPLPRNRSRCFMPLATQAPRRLRARSVLDGTRSI